MKLSCTKENLHQALSITSHLTSKNINLPILQNVLLKVEGGSIRFTTTNLEMAIGCTVRGKVEEPGEHTIPSKLFFDYVSLLPNEIVNLVVDGDIASIECGSNKTKIKGINSSEFPLVPEVKQIRSYEVPAEAFRNALRRFPDLHRNVTLIQIVVPSRADIPMYHDLKTEIERLVGEINGEFTQSGWIPIHYIFRHLESIELLAYYRTCEIALLTPLKDGMNLVAKEYCASSLEENGVLILIEFAGAVAQLQKGALIVNPYDFEGIASAIYRAYTMHIDARR